MSAWEFYPDESKEAFQAFTIYRDMGPSRSIDKVAIALHPEKEQEGGGRAAYGRLFEWSSRYRWVARAREYDIEQARIQRAAWEEEQRELARKRLQVSHKMLDRVNARLDSIMPDDILVSQLPRWAEASAKVSVVIGDCPEDQSNCSENREQVEAIMADPKALRLALELDERLFEMSESQSRHKEELGG